MSPQSFIFQKHLRYFLCFATFPVVVMQKYVCKKHQIMFFKEIYFRLVDFMLDLIHLEVHLNLLQQNKN